jgi:Trypsin-like peptidase domain
MFLLMAFWLSPSSLFGQTASGSGFIIHPEGYLLTNHHVVASANQITVVVPGKGSFAASVVADDDYKDLALLKIEVSNLAYLPIGESQKVKVLDTIYVLGYPLAPALGADVSASEGQVNAIRDSGKIPLLQIDANVNPGNSGGPVLNDRGEVVGVVVSKINAAFFLKETGSIPERVNFAIPINEARGMVRQAYPLDFEPSQKAERLSNQEIFAESRKATVFIIANSASKEVLKSSKTPAPQALAPQTGNPWDFIVSVEKNLNEHNWRGLAPYLVDGHVNYFGHRDATLQYIARDMENDRLQYPSSQATYYADTFTHEVSDEYSPHWTGPMLYDSINVYSVVTERSGRVHRALIRLTVGYTLNNGALRIYALVMKVLPANP